MNLKFLYLTAFTVVLNVGTARAEMIDFPQDVYNDILTYFATCSIDTTQQLRKDGELNDLQGDIEGDIHQTLAHEIYQNCLTETIDNAVDLGPNPKQMRARIVETFDAEIQPIIKDLIASRVENLLKSSLSDRQIAKLYSQFSDYCMRSFNSGFKTLSDILPTTAEDITSAEARKAKNQMWFLDTTNTVYTRPGPICGMTFVGVDAIGFVDYFRKKNRNQFMETTHDKGLQREYFMTIITPEPGQTDPNAIVTFLYSGKMFSVQIQASE